MSNSQAIAAVTATLQSILQGSITLDPDLNDTVVTIQPLDKARGTSTTNQVNVFLYMISRSATWVNADLPRQVGPGESGVPPLALSLYYLITAFGRDDDQTQPFGHELLGKAMSVLNDFPVLSAAEITAATQAALPNNDLAQQVERIRITFHPLSIDELSKLWTGFAMQYRLSAAYEVAVTLIESTRAARAPVPVLTRGAQDRGFNGQASLTSPLPTLFSITPPNQQSSARLGEVVTLTGVHLDGSMLGVRFNHPLWTAPIELTAQPGGTSTALSVQIPNQPADWPAGFYTVDVLLQRPGETFRRVTNQLVVSLAPLMNVAPPSAPSGSIAYSVTVAPDVRPTQRATLILGDQEFAAAAHPNPTGTLSFATTGLVAGNYWARLRVDGVDSILVDRTTVPPVFVPTQKVTVT